MTKRIPKFKTDQEASDFLEQDLSEYMGDPRFKRVTFEFAAKDTSVTMRMPEALVKSVKTFAKKKHVPYQRVIRMAIEQFMTKAA